MKLAKEFAAIALAAASATVAFAQSAASADSEYLRTFGQLMYERNGITDLKLTPEEFNVFVEGMKAARDGKALPENIQQLGPKMLDYLRTRAEANMKKEAEKAAAEAAEFWKKLEKDASISKTPTGLAYKITKEGTGDFPKEDSQVSIKYKGTLINGKVFDDGSKEPVSFSLEKVIPGFREGLQKMKKGGTAVIYVPAALGYGNNPLPGIPPNSTLIFDVELLDILPPAKPANQPAPAPQAAPSGAAPAPQANPAPQQAK